MGAGSGDGVRVGSGCVHEVRIKEEIIEKDTEADTDEEQTKQPRKRKKKAKKAAKKRGGVRTCRVGAFDKNALPVL